MLNRIKRWTYAVLMVSLFSAQHTAADEINVAVASNFVATLTVLAEQFTAASGYRVVVIAGSTGKHYAQIKHGAPFDVFLAADRQRPQQLEQDGLALERFTYARGRLVLWSPQAGYVDAGGEIIKSDHFRFMAMANPKLAPYGRAAREVLQAQGQWQNNNKKLVRGENIAQAYQFVKSGNAELGFVAYAQILSSGGATEGSFWLVPQTLYSPIEQQAVLLRKSVAATAFMAFMRSEPARQIIQNSGYETP